MSMPVPRLCPAAVVFFTEIITVQSRVTMCTLADFYWLVEHEQLVEYPVSEPGIGPLTRFKCSAHPHDPNSKAELGR